jgi:hypothetical protein
VTCMAVYTSPSVDATSTFFSPRLPKFSRWMYVLIGGPIEREAMRTGNPGSAVPLAHTHAPRKPRKCQPSKPSMRPSHAYHACLFRREATGYTLSNLEKGSLKQCRSAVDMNNMAGRQKAQTTSV